MSDFVNSGPSVAVPETVPAEKLSIYDIPCTSGSRSSSESSSSPSTSDDSTSPSNAQSTSHDLLRKRTPSPGNDSDGSKQPHSPENSSTDPNNTSNESVGLRVGEQYQATLPDFIPPEKRTEDTKPNPPRETMVWSPEESIPDEKLTEYVLNAKEKHGYERDQSLGLLFWHKYNFDLANADMEEFKPYKEEWTDIEKSLFNAAIASYGKKFNLEFHLLLKEKSTASMVEYYYFWKLAAKKIKNDRLRNKAKRKSPKSNM